MALTKSPPGGDTHEEEAMAIRRSIKQVVDSATRQFASPFAPVIRSISIALRQSGEDHAAAGQQLEVHIYAPFDGSGASDDFMRLEGYLRNLQPEEMGDFADLVKGVLDETVQVAVGDDEDDEDDDEEESPKVQKLLEQLAGKVEIIEALGRNIEELEKELKQYEADSEDDIEMKTELKRLRELIAEGDLVLSKRNEYITKLERRVKQQNDDSEDAEKTRSEMKALRKKLNRSEQLLKDQAAVVSEQKEDLAWYYQHSKATPSASRNTREVADDMAIHQDASDNLDAEDSYHVKGGQIDRSDAAGLDHAEDRGRSIDGTEAKSSPDNPERSEEPASRAKTKKSPSSVPIPSPRDNAKGGGAQHGRKTRQNSKADETTKKPAAGPQSRKMLKGTGIFHKGYELEDGWSSPSTTA